MHKMQTSRRAVLGVCLEKPCGDDKNTLTELTQKYPACSPHHQYIWQGCCHGIAQKVRGHGGVPRRGMLVVCK